ncbi:MAG TPA: ribbon-helix-helix protein, CopG family [Myxococcales bacterium]|nr:ribbon-helix-helix protein, CopG family [Myxococcales bacterium]
MEREAGTVRDDQDKQRLYLYLPVDVVAEIDEVAERLDRSRSWVVQRAWKVARESLDQLPPIPGAEPKE